ncbi:MAG: SagB/ThcOx family dehydrogenase [Luteitalea sp.]|nr:SagB/ThcOx family dehydrogenase [Luteitalea sp.]
MHMSPSSSSRPTVVRYRRAATMVCYWKGARLYLENYRTRVRMPARVVLLEVLEAFDTWRTIGAARRRLDDVDAKALAQLVEALCDASFLERSVPGQRRAGNLLGRWVSWAPEAPFFHFASRDVTFAPPEVARRSQRAKARRDPPPSPIKRVRALARVALPAPALDASLVPTLLARRTWRRFGSASITLAHVATLAGLTWGVQEWVNGGVFGKIPLKTSPSGGARHSLEVYVLALNVRGLSRGLYHYRGDVHGLHLMRRGATAAEVRAFLPSQDGYGDTAALFLMTSVIPRVEWRYPSSRAYRVVLLEAGHFCQTFCLVATALGLAPFCTAALADTIVERAVGIDGVDEAVLYAAGVGSRPPGVAWAPYPDTSRAPRRSVPAWKRRQ